MDQINYHNKYQDINLEQWKYTNINNFKNFNSIFIPKNNVLQKKCKPYEIIMYNGYLYKCGSSIENEKIVISNISEAVDNNVNNCKKIFNSILPKKQDVYLGHNTLNHNFGYYIHIPDNLKNDKTIIIKNIIDQGDQSSFLNYRNLVHCGKNVEIKILNEEIFLIDQCINIAFETYINENSNLEIINHCEKPATTQIYNFSASINNNSNLNYHALDISGNLLKNNYYINLNGSGSSCFFNGFNISNNKEHNDNYIQINHNSPHTISNLNYKIIANKISKSILFVKSIINKDSHHSEAYQKNKNLILSDKAIVHANPQLEIYNDDVQCSHGSATGQIDDEAIYYMRTRGINEKLAKELILNSFIDENIEKISDIEIQQKLKLKIKNYLSNGH